MKLVISKYLKKLQFFISGRSLEKETVTLVEQFYLSNDVSYVMPGIKDVINVKDKSGKRMKLQKHLLLLNLKEIYQLFKMQYPELKIGFTKFTTLKPRNCVLACSNGTHNVCVCPFHQNIKLMLEG